MLTIDILGNPPFNLNAQECSDFMALAKRFDITLDGYLTGAVYSKTPYTEDQQVIIKKELEAAFARAFAGKVPSKKQTYTSTAGAPGTGKSIFLEQLIDNNPELQGAVYVDPDRQALRFMDSYKQMSKEQSGEIAYETYRDASNYICNFSMAWAIYKGYDIVHGTTSTNDRVAKSILPGLKENGYNVNVHVLFADAESRTASLEHRIKVQDFYQVTQLDAKGKVAPVYDRITDAYLKYADTVTMYYNTSKFWLCENVAQSQECLKQFATFDRAKNSDMVVKASNSEDILDKIIAEVSTEISDKEKQDSVIAMFKSWPEAERTKLRARF